MSSNKPKDIIPGRGERKSTPLGTCMFIGLRAADVLLQRYILLNAPLTPLLRSLNITPSPAPAGGAVSPALGLSPYQSVLLAMSAGSAIKQIYWLLFLSFEPMYPFNSIFIAGFNTMSNSLNTLLFTANLPYMLQQYPEQIYIGAGLYFVGILIETVAEIQRRSFKDDPRNKGKPYSGGLFSLARSINYGGYTLWRGGFALAAGGSIWGAFIAFGMAYDFATRAIPVMDEYCSGRYGAQWTRVKEKVPYKLLPYVY